VGGAPSGCDAPASPLINNRPYDEVARYGAPGEEDGQIEQRNPGHLTQGQTESEASAPAGAGDCLSHSESGAERIVSKLAWLAFARMATRLAGLHVGAFWDPDDPTLISLPGPAWFNAE
jgi:hypothetical protein